MIEVFYKLKRLPFQKDINLKDMFACASSEELFSRLEHMKQQRGIMLITGTPGTGKTLHIRAFVEKLNPVGLRFIPALLFKLKGPLHNKLTKDKAPCNIKTFMTTGYPIKPCRCLYSGYPILNNNALFGLG